MIQASRCGIQLYLILVGCQFFYESRTICHKFRLYTGFAAGRQPLLSVLASVLRLPLAGT